MIGGHGRMGALVARMFGDLGHQVIVADVDTELSAGDAAAVADVVVVSVPIDATEDVIRAVGPRVRDDALLMDVTSIKEAPVAAMLASTRASVVGTHPMFGPNVHSLQGQRVVVCRARGDEWADWVVRMLQARGLSVQETTPGAPRPGDGGRAGAHALPDAGARPDAGATRHAARRDAAVHVAGVPHGAVRDGAALRSIARSVRPDRDAKPGDGARDVPRSEPRPPRSPTSSRSGDRERFRQLFEEVREFFGPFTHEALEQSSFLIDRLVERL